MSEVPEKGAPDQEKDVHKGMGGAQESQGLQAWKGDFDGKMPGDEHTGDEKRQALGDGQSSQALERIQEKEPEVVAARKVVGDAMEACRQQAQVYREAERNLRGAHLNILEAAYEIRPELEKPTIIDPFFIRESGARSIVNDVFTDLSDAQRAANDALAGQSDAQRAVNDALAEQESYRLSWRRTTLTKELASFLNQGKTTKASYYGAVEQVMRLDTSFGVVHSSEVRATLAQLRSEAGDESRRISRQGVNLQAREEDHLTRFLEAGNVLAEEGSQLLAEQGPNMSVDDVNFIGDPLAKAMAKFVEARGDFDRKKSSFEVAQGALQERVNALESALDTYEDHGLLYGQAREQLQASGETYVSADLERTVRESDPQKIVDDVTGAGKVSYKDRIKLEIFKWAYTLRWAAPGW